MQKKNPTLFKKSKEFFDPAKESPIARFTIGMTKIEDEHLYILRGHLLIEELLRELINLKMRKSDALIEARLTFNQILCIVKAIYWQRDYEWLWESIMILNNARNSISHKLAPDKYNRIIDSFLKLVEKKNPSEDIEGLSNKARLFIAMCFIYNSLSTFLVEQS